MIRHMKGNRQIAKCGYGKGFTGVQPCAGPIRGQVDIGESYGATQPQKLATPQRVKTNDFNALGGQNGLWFNME